MSNCRFLCYYCLKAFSSPDELTLHLSTHVHYTNKSLINCTICVLNEKMWQKGFVDGILIDSAGILLHSVQFKSRRETLNLADTNFCISSKPTGFEESMNANREESVFGHTLTKEFVITQSILARIYGQQDSASSELSPSTAVSLGVLARGAPAEGGAASRSSLPFFESSGCSLWRGGVSPVCFCIAFNSSISSGFRARATLGGIECLRSSPKRSTYLGTRWQGLIKRSWSREMRCTRAGGGCWFCAFAGLVAEGRVSGCSSIARRKV